MMTDEPRRIAFGELASSWLTPTRQEQFRLERLLELRAVIDSLRVQGGTESGRTNSDRSRYAQR